MKTGVVSAHVNNPLGNYKAWVKPHSPCHGSTTKHAYPTPYFCLFPDKIVAFQKARSSDDIAAMLPLLSDKIKLQTPKGVVEGRDAFIKYIKDGIK